MNTTSSSFRTDDQLAAIRDVPGDWLVTGRQGKGLCHAASFRLAIDRGADYAASGAVVVALCRLPSDRCRTVAPSHSGPKGLCGNRGACRPVIGLAECGVPFPRDGGTA
jgi:hypothetical protein